MITSLLAIQLYAQQPYALRKPIGKSRDANPFFALQYRGDSALAFRRVLHLYHRQQRFVTIFVTKPAHQKAVAITRVIIRDTSLIQQFPNQFQDSLLNSYTIHVVDSDDMEVEYPVEYAVSFTNKIGFSDKRQSGYDATNDGHIKLKHSLNAGCIVNLLNDAKAALISDTLADLKLANEMSFYSKETLFMQAKVSKERDTANITQLIIKDSSIFKKVNKRSGVEVLVQVGTSKYILFTRKDKTSEIDELKSVIEKPAIPVAKVQPLNGESVTEVVLGNNRYVNQTLPTNFVRQQLNVTSNLGLLPIHAYVSASTELSGISKTINYYGVSFDFEQLRKNLTQMSVTPEVSDGLGLSTNGLKETDEQQFFRKIEMKRISLLTDSLKNILGNAEYSSRVKTDSLSLIGADTSNLSYAQKISYNRLRKHQEHSTLLNKYEQQLKKIEQEERRAKVRKYMRSDYQVSRQQLKKKGISNMAGFWINSVRKLDIGAVAPYYSDLTLSQLNLLGIHTELGLGYLYLAFTAGRENNFGLQQDMRNNNATVVAGRIGVGSPDRLLFSFNIVKATHDRKSVLDSGLNNVRDNLVTSASVNYNLRNEHRFFVEYAKSVVNVAPKEQVEVNEIMSSRNQSSGAIVAGAEGKMGKRGSYYFETKYTEPYYFSVGAPNLRQDHFKINGRVKQSLFKSRISLSTGYQFDRDNLSLTKRTTSTQHKVTTNARVKLTGSTQLIVGYIPVWTDVMYQPTGTFYSTYLGLSTVSIINQKKYRSTSNLLNITYQGSELSTRIQKRSSSTSLHYINVLNSLFLRKYNLTLTGTGSAYTSTQTDSSYGYSAGLSFRKQLDKYKLLYGLGTRYQVDRATERRYVLSAEFSMSLPYRMYCAVKAEQHFIRQQIELGDTYNQQQFSILFTKRF